jgi:hypothetical protein
MGGPIIIWPPDVCDGFPGCYAPMRAGNVLILEALLSLFLF